MAKIVDVAERRAAVAEACCRVIARDGIAGVTTRNVATEAGIGSGLLFHYFAGKDDIIVAAFEHLQDQFRARAYPAMERAPDALERLRAMAKSNLPLDKQQRLEFGVWLSMWAQSYSSKALRTSQRDLYQRWRDMLADLVRAAIDEGLIRSEIDPIVAGAQVGALTDGFIVQIILDAEHPEVKRLAMTAVDSLIDSWRPHGVPPPRPRPRKPA